MSVTNISEIIPTQLETLSLIEAIESDFSQTERVLIKADWTMQNVVKELQNNNLSDNSRVLLIKQLNATITSVQSELYQDNQIIPHNEPNVA